MNILSFLLSKEKSEPVKEIIRAIRVIKKHDLQTTILLRLDHDLDKFYDNRNSLDKPIEFSAEKVVEISKNISNYQAIVVRGEQIINHTCLAPFPDQICWMDLTDREIGGLGFCQSGEVIAITVSRGRISLFYNNSFRLDLNETVLSQLLDNIYLNKIDQSSRFVINVT
jgi:hypothetical protein